MDPRRLAPWFTLAAVLAAPVSFSSERAPSMPSDAKTDQFSVIATTAGQVVGRFDGALHAFKGIPYAAPPVGAARWKPPAPVKPWEGVRQATQFGPSCIQPVTPTPNVYTSDITPTSEDCLNLNVWAPAGAKGAPVFVWIHGGALVKGSSSEPMYDGARMAREGIVVVSINYRLGVLGYLAHPGLSTESPDGVSGNYGLLDQIAALRWVKENIGNFGGDPANVTIAGESAGALSVMYLMASPPARGLFAKAIAESAYMISTPALKEKVHGQMSSQEMGARLGGALKATSIADMRRADAQELTEAAAKLGFAPFATIDGKTLTRQLVETFESGEQAPVPLLAGFNSGEIRSLAFLAPPPPDSADKYEASIRDNYGDLADEFLRLYPSSNMQESVYATTRDGLYGWTAEQLIRKQVAIGQPAYLYYFDHGTPASDAAGLHAFHASELPYVFGNLDRTPKLWPAIPETAAENAMADAMLGYWSSFARSGTPQAEGAPAWPSYGTTAAYMDFGDAPQAATNLLPGMYELHEEAVRRRRASGDQPWNWNVGLVSPKLVK